MDIMLRNQRPGTGMADLLCEPLMRLPKFRKNLMVAIQSFRIDLQNICIDYLPSNCLQSDQMMAGSAAELSFDTSRTCIGDVDSMTWNIAECACFNIDDDCITTDLFNKGNFVNRRTEIYDVTPCEQYPGYVRVESYGYVNVHRKTHNSTKLECKPHAEKKKLTHDWAEQLSAKYSASNVKSVRRGPALKILKPQESNGVWFGDFDLDLVFCLRCPFWPPGALGWTTRRRRHQWPSQEAIALVVENGCHIVPVAHIDCSKDPYQWRISFSKAELILIKSWNPSQQYAYHLLRYFAKKELFKKDWRNTDEILSTYSLKTLMLWQCERKSSEWWQYENERDLCCKLLKLLNILLDWLLKLKCRNYFITNSNLFAHEMNIANYDETIETLSWFENAEQLKEWFHDNYLLEDNDDFVDMAKLLELNNREVMSKSAKFDESLYKCVLISDCVLHLSVPTPDAGYVASDGSIHPYPLSQERCLRQIGLIEGVFVDFYKAHVLLQVATKYTTGHKADYLVAMLSSLFLNQSRICETIGLPPMKQYDVFLMIERERYYELAEYVLAGHSTNYETDHHLQIKLGKTLIKKELKIFDNIPSINCLQRKLLLHLGGLYFASKRYESCLKQVTLASQQEQSFQGSSFDHPALIDGRYLGFVDEVVFAIGLLQITRRSKYKPMFVDPNTATSLDFFSYWMSCLSLIRQPDLMKKYDRSILKSYNKPTTLTDVFLFRIMQKQILIFLGANKTEQSNIKPITNSSASEMYSLDASREDNFCDIITKCAVTNLTKFYRSLREDEDFKDKTCVKAMSHYKALYSFKRGRYDVTLKLCNDILEEERSCENLNCTCFDPGCMCMKPPYCFPFQDLFDPDFNCLIGLFRLINSRFDNPEVSEIDRMTLDRDYTFPFIRPYFIAKYLTVQSLLKCKTDKKSYLTRSAN